MRGPVIFFTPFSASSESSAFSPTLFVGEKVAKPDEGAFQRVRHLCMWLAFRQFGRGVVDRSAYRLPPHPSFGHLLPPQKARGEKALDGKALQEKEEV